MSLFERRCSRPFLIFAIVLDKASIRMAVLAAPPEQPS
jgi:hypothetical protein